MKSFRRDNNEIKREFLTSWVPRGSNVLDVGCGQGGDVHKWKYISVKLTGIDPNPIAIEEAKRRSRGYGTFMDGYIYNAPLEKYDIICYNFSLQYQPIEYIDEIKKRLGPGGLLIGVVTDPERIHLAQEYGIHVEKYKNIISVYIPGTPYYAHGSVDEPIFQKDEYLKHFKCILWEPFSIYAKFVFQVIL
jgi:SAM-dependent methyltransferase